MQVDVSPESDNTPHEDNFIIESATLVSFCDYMVCTVTENVRIWVLVQLKTVISV